ncbi:MAG: ssk1 response regulator receiver [Thelocarpon superellum]|nr:MAG: ssk1 response regulator receiver [Thelocarpon superellum]
MATRKIWVKRPGASATLVPIHDDDLVDDVRDKILSKYANSLGRCFDAPDVMLCIVTRESMQRHSREGQRVLGPEESIGRTLDSYYPGGQTVDEALVIDVPTKRTPKASPRAGHHTAYYPDEPRPGEGGDYFPPMPAIGSPHLPSASVATHGTSQGSHHPPVHSIAVISTGQVPSLPSPGLRGPRHSGRPRMGRTHTTSPPILNGAPSTMTQVPPGPPPLPTPPLAETAHKAGTPPARTASPRPRQARKAKKIAEPPHLPAGLLEGAVPPINVLIVEDNIINLKLLEAFMKRLKVRWQTAMNGREAVTKWRAGGFHLVLMDIQLPVMNGLDATKEIRRLERLNSIGVFSSSASSSAPESASLEPEGDDKLPNTVLFKSPVIIVALTASSLQSDRHEALAAGCNDFLTKPVNFVWLESKVMEWGCMQALIDFDGWRKWKDFSQGKAADVSHSSSAGSKSNSNKGNKPPIPPSTSSSSTITAATVSNSNSNSTAYTTTTTTTDINNSLNHTTTITSPSHPTAMTGHSNQTLPHINTGTGTGVNAAQGQGPGKGQGQLGQGGHAAGRGKGRRDKDHRSSRSSISDVVSPPPPPPSSSSSSNTTATAAPTSVAATTTTPTSAGSKKEKDKDKDKGREKESSKAQADKANKASKAKTNTSTKEKEKERARVENGGGVIAT